MNQNIKKILLVSIGDGKLFFCAADKNKIVLFDELLYGLLSSVTNTKTVISVVRNEKEICSGIPFTVEDEAGSVSFEDFDRIRKEAKVSEENWQYCLKNQRFPASYFQQDDILLIDKDWKDFEKHDEWPSMVFENKNSGTEFFEICNDTATIEKIAIFFDLKSEDIISKNIVVIDSSLVDA